MPETEMLWRSSTFRQVCVRSWSEERWFSGVPVSRGVHDGLLCAANPRFVAVATECSGGGAFLVLPVHQTGRLDPQHPRVCGHRGPVLDLKWNPFDDHCLASCSEDCTVKIWEVPACGVQQNLTRPRKTLIGHCRRAGLIEWHPTAQNLLLSSAYDYKVLLWDVSQPGPVLRVPVRVVLMPVLRRFPAEALLLSASFSADGSRLAVTSRDRRVRVLDPRTGQILQVSRRKSHRASKVLFLRGTQMLVSTGRSTWNHRQMVLWDPTDLSEPLFELDLDGSAGVLFPFYDPDTHLLYLAGKGDGNIRLYELSADRPHVHFLSEFRSLLPHRGLGVMPKRGLDLSACEIFRFYRLIAVKDRVEPLSVIVPRKNAEVFQEDLYPLTAANRAAMTAQEWLAGVNRGPLMMSLKPEPRPANPYPESPAERGGANQRNPTGPGGGANLDFLPEATDGILDVLSPGDRWCEQVFLQEQVSYQDAKFPGSAVHLSGGWQPDGTQRPRPAETQLLQEFYQQQEQIRGLKEQLDQRETKIAQLELELRTNRDQAGATL